MKKKNVSMFELWDKSSKARKLTSTSTTSPVSVEVERILQLALVQVHDEAPQPERKRCSLTPIVEDDEAVDEDEIDLAIKRYIGFYNGAQSAGAAVAWQVDRHKTSLISQLFVIWGLMTLSCPLLALLVFLAVKDEASTMVVKDEDGLVSKLG